MLRAIVFALLSTIATSTNAGATEDVVIPTAEDGDITARFDKETRKPLGAMDAHIEILGANITFEPRATEATKIHWGWTFAVKMRDNSRPIGVVIHDETTKPVALVCEKHPLNIKNEMWACIGDTRPLSKQFMKFFSDGNTMFRIFRFTITYDDGTVSKLHQPALYRPADIDAMLRTTMQLLQPSLAPASEHP